MTLLLQNVINGLSAGSLYALLAVGIVLIYKSSEVLNFAHGSFAMLATFAAYELSAHPRTPFIRLQPIANPLSRETACW